MHFCWSLSAKPSKPIQISVHSVSSFCTVTNNVNNTAVTSHTVHSLVCRKILVLSCVHVRSNILYQVLSVVNIISKNCRMLHLWPLNVNVFQMLIDCGKSMSTRLWLVWVGFNISIPGVIHRQARQKPAISDCRSPILIPQRFFLVIVAYIILVQRR